MDDDGAGENPEKLLWMVTIAGGSAFPQGAYSMAEVDPLTCVFQRPGSPSFQIPAADVVRYEQAGVLHIEGPLAANDNGSVAGNDSYTTATTGR